MKKTYGLFYAIEGFGQQLWFVTALKEEAEMMKLNDSRIGAAHFMVGEADMTDDQRANNVDWYIPYWGITVKYTGEWPIFMPSERPF